MRRHRIVTVIAGLLVVLGAVAVGAWRTMAGTANTVRASAPLLTDATAPNVHSPAGRANQAAARTDAAALLARLKLPAGALSSATEPNGAGTALAKPGMAPATPNLVDDHGWRVVPGKPAAALAYIKAHPPAGSKLDETESGNAGSGFLLDGYSWAPRAGVLSSRQLAIEVVSVGGGMTALRADALVVWITPRPASERIPGTVDGLQVTVLNGKRVTQGPLTFKVIGQVKGVRSLIDSLPAAQPGVSACPADFAIRVRLVFYAAGSARPLAVALVDPYGCQGVQLKIRGKAQPPLSSAASPGSRRVHAPALVLGLDRLLGWHLSVGPAGQPSASTILKREPG